MIRWTCELKSGSPPFHICDMKPDDPQGYVRYWWWTSGKRAKKRYQESPLVCLHKHHIVMRLKKK